jgi:Uncharacterized protein conserved in bacteria (DUF2252)
MQPASDIFLGWVTAPNGRQFYVRQLHDAKIKPLVETFDAVMLDAYARACGWVLARAHAKASEISATITGYLGSSNDAFDTAMGKIRVGLCGPGRVRSCRAQGCSAKGRDCRYQRRLEHDPKKSAMVIRPNPIAPSDRPIFRGWTPISSLGSQNAGGRAQEVLSHLPVAKGINKIDRYQTNNIFCFRPNRASYQIIVGGCWLAASAMITSLACRPVSEPAR